MNAISNSHDTDQLLEIELEQTFETFRALFRLVVSIFTILITANVTLVGYAMANQTALMLGMGAIFPLGGLAILVFVGRMFVPLLHTALTIESEIKHRPDLFFWSLAAVMAGSSVPRFRSIAALEEPQERLVQLRQQFGNFVPFGRLTSWGLLILAVLQVLAVPFVHFVSGWPLI